MEVTNTNFKDVLNEIEKSINGATFLSIDCEFTGLNTVSEINAYDNPKQYYEKIRKNSRQFLVIQYGISAFRFDETDKIFKQQSYNFYIFRRPINRNIPDQRFLCQTSCIDFLMTQGFDFNKLFTSGISYLNVDEENECREKLQQKQKRNSFQNQMNSNDNISIPPDAKPIIDKVIKQLKEFLTSNNSEVELPKCNAFIRKLIYQTVAEKFQNKIVLQTKTMNNKDRILFASKFKSVLEQEENDRKLHEEDLTLLDDFIGFTKVLRIIVDSGKLIVGHNMLLDFLHTIDKFLTPLSSDYGEFKECAHSLLQNVLDTKFMANSDDFKDLFESTVLKDVLETVSKAPFQVPPNVIEKDGKGYSSDEPKAHEAGYDAYITGICFISMWYYLGQLKNLKIEDIFSDFTLLESFTNKLYLMILRDNQYINLAGPDPNPSRNHVFYLTFPKEWKSNNIIELFSPFGSVYVAFLNDTSAYVGLHKKDQASVALNTLSQSDTYKIMTFAKRQAQLEEVKTAAPSIGKKRTLESTPKMCNKKLKTEVSTIALTDSESDKCIKKTKTFYESETWD